MKINLHFYTTFMINPTTFYIIVANIFLWMGTGGWFALAGLGVNP